MTGQSPIAGESPDLAGGSSNFGKGANGEHDNDDGGHDVGSGVRLGCVVEYLDKRVEGGGCSHICGVAERKANCDDHDEYESDVEEDGTHDSTRYSNGVILDFLG